jgi:hypothetical protein
MPGAQLLAAAALKHPPPPAPRAFTACTSLERDGERGDRWRLGREMGIEERKKKTLTCGPD